MRRDLRAWFPRACRHPVEPLRTGLILLAFSWCASDAAALINVAAIDTPNNLWEIEVVGDLAYVAADPSGLLIIDVSVPSAPFEIGAIPAASFLRHSHAKHPAASGGAGPRH